MLISTCGGCNKTFSSLTLFDRHRIGGYGDALYAEQNTKSKSPVAYNPHNRHCMTTQELLDAGYQFEQRSSTAWLDGKSQRLERDVWYDPVAREEARAAFRKIEDEAED